MTVEGMRLAEPGAFNSLKNNHEGEGKASLRIVPSRAMRNSECGTVEGD